MRWTRFIPHEHNVFCSHCCDFHQCKSRKIRRHLESGARNQLVSFQTYMSSHSKWAWWRFVEWHSGENMKPRIKGGFTVYPENDTWLIRVMWPRRDVEASVTDLRWRWRHVPNYVMTVGWMCRRARMAARLYVYKRWSGGWRPVSHSFLQLLARISVSVGRRQLNDWTQCESSSDSEFGVQLLLT